MNIIIDGYNVLKTVYGVQFITEQQRKDFIGMLAAYGNKKRHQMYVIFDGEGPYRSPPTAKALTVMYAGVKTTADEVILSLLTENRGDTTLLVSNDRVLVKAAHKQGNAVIDAELFYTHVAQSVEGMVTAAANAVQAKAAVKAVKVKGHDSSAEVDALMEQVNPVKKEDGEVVASRTSKHRELSTEHKKLRRLVKKL
jgi:predicted RNA-binding protein with PIN domain